MTKAEKIAGFIAMATLVEDVDRYDDKNQERPEDHVMKEKLNIIEAGPETAFRRLDDAERLNCLATAGAIVAFWDVLATS